MLGPFATASRLTPIHQMLLAVLSRAACTSMSTTTTTTRDRGDRYGPMEWTQKRKDTYPGNGLHCEAKKQDTRLLSVTSPNASQFLIFFSLADSLVNLL